MTNFFCRGAFSEVFEAVSKETGVKYAAKSIKKKYIKKTLLEREIEIMTRIRHDNILFCKEVYESDDYIYLILELYLLQTNVN
jgi:serine/threonine protein kinase